MSVISARQVLADLTRLDQGTAHPRWNWAQGLYLGVALLAAAGVYVAAQPSLPVGPLLTATSILTGMTFTMALRFWDRSIEARRDPSYATNAARLNLVDRMKAHLIWTVVVGVSSTFVLALVALIVDTDATPPATAAVVGGLVIYEISLVAGALLEFYRASYDLR